MNKLPGKATVLLNQDGMRISFEDRSSGITLHAELDERAMVKALSRQAFVDCQIKWPEDTHLIGKTREVCTLSIEKTWAYGDGLDWHQTILKQCEKEGLFVDGWELQDDGLRRRQDAPGKHFVVLERYI